MRLVYMFFIASKLDIKVWGGFFAVVLWVFCENKTSENNPK